MLESRGINYFSMCEGEVVIIFESPPKVLRRPSPPVCNGHSQGAGLIEGFNATRE